jgi:hypothetical protein
MVWKPGETGNPEGSRKMKLWRESLDRAITQDDGKRLRAAAERLLDMAADGDIAALNHLADRLDGKPAQALTVGGDAENPLALVTKVELVTLAAPLLIEHADSTDQAA